MDACTGQQKQTAIRRREVAAIAGGLTALLGAACRPGEGSAGGGVLGPLTKEPVTLRLMQRAAPEEQFAHKYAAEYSERYPNIKVVLEETPTPDYWTKVLTVLASDQLPDLVWAWSPEGRLAAYANAGVFRPLDDLVRADKLDLAQFYPGAIEADRWEGKLWALPTVAHPGEVTIYYNQNLLDAASVKTPDLTTTVDDVVAGARRVMDLVNASRADGNKVWGYHSGRGYFQAIIRLRAFGGDVLSADGKQAVLNTPAARATLQWEYDTIARHRIAPSPSDMQGVGFLDGNVALMGNNVANVAIWRRTIGERFRWAPTLFPAGPGGKRGTSLHTGTMHIGRPTRYVAEGWELIKLLSSHEVGVQKVLMNSGTPGARPDVWNDPRLHAFEPFYKVGATLMPEARPHPVAFNLKTTEALDALNQGLPEIWTSKVSPATGAEQIARTMQAVLDRPR